MKTALTIWGNRISPVFHSSSKLLIITVSNQKIVDRYYEYFEPWKIDYFITKLEYHNVSVFICGAITKTSARIIKESSVRLLPFATGKIPDVLDSYLLQNKLDPSFIMPGSNFNFLNGSDHPE